MDESLEDVNKALGDYHKRMMALLKNIGDVGQCRGCLAAIVWVTHKNGKWVAYTWDGANHFANCPVAADFKRGK